MSRTDKTRPWWVQVVDAPGSTCRPVHDHRWGPCTLPREIVAVRALFRPGPHPSGCYWAGTAAHNMRRCESHGSREWNLMRREDRRRNRRQARRELRVWNGDD
jgi:hypothetical protein